MDIDTGSGPELEGLLWAGIAEEEGSEIGKRTLASVSLRVPWETEDVDDESSWPLALALPEVGSLMLDAGVLFWCDVNDFTSLDEEEIVNDVL